VGVRDAAAGALSPAGLTSCVRARWVAATIYTPGVRDGSGGMTTSVIAHS
jgi:hypothetical protein